MDSASIILACVERVLAVVCFCCCYGRGGGGGGDFRLTTVPSLSSQSGANSGVVRWVRSNPPS